MPAISMVVRALVVLACLWLCSNVPPKKSATARAVLPTPARLSAPTCLP